MRRSAFVLAALGLTACAGPGRPMTQFEQARNACYQMALLAPTSTGTSSESFGRSAQCDVDPNAAMQAMQQRQQQNKPVTCYANPDGSVSCY